MTNEQLMQANSLTKKMVELEEIIKSSENQTCEWIEFTFGNGSNRANVCNDKDIIQSVRELIVRENRKKLAKLREDF